MARLNPIDLLRSCRSESSLISFVNNLSGQYIPYEYGAHGHGYDYNYDSANEGIISNADNDNEDIISDADNASDESDMHLPIRGYGGMVDTYIALARRMAASSLNHDISESSSSSRSLAGTETVLPRYTVTQYIVFWRNGFTVNDGPLRDLDDPESDYFFQCLRDNAMPTDLVPSTGDRVRVHINCILRNENHPADPARLNTRIEVDETRPTTTIQLRFSDHNTRENVRFNFHHTVADIRAYFDASRPEENQLYNLLVVIPPCRYRGLLNPDETIQDAALLDSIIEQRRY